MTLAQFLHRVIAGVRDEGGLAPALIKAKRLLRERGLRFLLMGDVTAPLFVSYRAWVRDKDSLSRDQFRAFARMIEEQKSAPSFSVILPTYETDVRFLQEAVESVKSQIYPNWELCIADDASTNEELIAYLEEISYHPKIKVVRRKTNGHISACTNSALELASSEWVTFLDHDDVLAVDALFQLARQIWANPELKLIYSDEDKIDEFGNRSYPFFKSDFNLEWLRGCNYICHLAAYRREKVEEIGGLRLGYEGAQDHDLVLRYVETCHPSEIAHIPAILYHWRMHQASTAMSISAKPYASHAGTKAVEEHLERVGIEASVERDPRGAYFVDYAMPKTVPSVTIVIPTRNQQALLKACIRSVVEKTNYPKSKLEICIVDNGSDCQETRNYLDSIRKAGIAKVSLDSRPFNFSQLNNTAVAGIETDFVVFMNNDVEVISSDWLRELVSTASQGDVGAVGAKLLYPDNTVQHGGVVIGCGHAASHAFVGLAQDDPGIGFRPVIRNEFSAVTGACLLIRTALFKEVSGFDEEHFGVALNDTDLCLKVRERGFRNVYCPKALLYHHESKSRGYEITPDKLHRFEREAAKFRQRWFGYYTNDPCFNINFGKYQANFHQEFSTSPRFDLLGYLDPSTEARQLDGLGSLEAGLAFGQVELLKRYLPSVRSYARVGFVGAGYADAVALLARRRQFADLMLVQIAEEQALDGSELKRLAALGVQVRDHTDTTPAGVKLDVLIVDAHIQGGLLTRLREVADLLLFDSSADRKCRSET